MLKRQVPFRGDDSRVQRVLKGCWLKVNKAKKINTFLCVFEGYANRSKALEKEINFSVVVESKTTRKASFRVFFFGLGFIFPVLTLLSDCPVPFTCQLA